MTGFRLWFALLGNPLRRALWSIALHETGIFRNTISREHNNYFSYGYVKNSPYQAGGSPGHFAHYNTALDSVKDVTGWFKRRPKAFEALQAFNDSPTAQSAQNLAAEMRLSGYYTAPISTYSKALYSASNHNSHWFLSGTFYGLAVAGFVTFFALFAYICRVVINSSK